MGKWFGAHNYSTWMIVVSVILMAMTTHPSLLAYLFIMANAGWMLVTRELARFEGSSRGVSWISLGGGVALTVITILIMLKINWLAI